MEPTRVSLFIAGSRFVPTVRSLAIALNVVRLPAFVRSAAGTDRCVLSASAERFLCYLVLLGFLSTVGLFAFSSEIVELLYPDGFEDAVVILRILSLNIIPMFLHWEALNLLFSGEKYRELIAGYGLTFVVRLALGIWLGSAWGSTGLAVAQVTSDWILAMVLHVVALWVLRLSYGKTLLKTILCALVALLVLTMGVKTSVFPEAVGR